MGLKDKTLLFVPKAWHKIMFLLKKSKTDEVGGFGISNAEDLLLVEDFRLIKQEVTSAETKFDDASVAEHMAEMAKKGIEPRQCIRIWIHSHPFSNGVPSPSGTDEETFKNLMRMGAEWGIMVIFSGKTTGVFARLSMRTPFGGEDFLDVELTAMPFWAYQTNSKEQDGWAKEFTDNVSKPAPIVVHGGRGPKTIQLQLGAKRGASKTDWGKASKKQVAQYRAEWNRFPYVPGGLDISEYISARVAGYVIKEILDYGDLCTFFEPHVLRAAASASGDSGINLLEQQLANDELERGQFIE